MVLRVHQDKTYPGAMVASLSVPLGQCTRRCRRLTTSCGRATWWKAQAGCWRWAVAEARNILRYLIATQHAEGNWSQNQWLGGKPFWRGQQLDETAFPVLLAAALAERGALDGVEVRDMVRAP